MGEMCYGVTVISKKNKPLIKSNASFDKRYYVEIEKEDGRVIFSDQWNEWEAPPWYGYYDEIDNKNNMFIKHGRNGERDVKIPFRDESEDWLSSYIFTGKRNIEFMATKTNLNWVLDGLIIENIKQIEIQEWYD